MEQDYDETPRLPKLVWARILGDYPNSKSLGSFLLQLMRALGDASDVLDQEVFWKMAVKHDHGDADQKFIEEIHSKLNRSGMRLEFGDKPHKRTWMCLNHALGELLRIPEVLEVLPPMMAESVQIRNVTVKDYRSGSFTLTGLAWPTGCDEVIFKQRMTLPPSMRDVRNRADRGQLLGDLISFEGELPTKMERTSPTPIRGPGKVYFAVTSRRLNQDRGFPYGDRTYIGDLVCEPTWEDTLFHVLFYDMMQRKTVLPAVVALAKRNALVMDILLYVINLGGRGPRQYIVPPDMPIEEPKLNWQSVWYRALVQVGVNRGTWSFYDKIPRNRKGQLMVGCHHCGKNKEEKMWKCSGCAKAMYCSVSCQRADWDQNQHQCN